MELYDSNTTDGSGNPTGVRLGWGVISVDVSGQGSGIIRNPNDQSDLTLDAGDYYLYCIADLDNSINTTVGNGIGRTSGDQYTDIITVTVSGNTTKSITAADFIHTEP